MYLYQLPILSAFVTKQGKRRTLTLWFSTLFVLISVLVCTTAHAQDSPYQERLRPQVHFTPKAHWINDPNGLVYLNGIYHLFFQYYPKAINWGPMHWGHAVSKDLIHWKELPIALYPDSLGYIFSGSAVYDKNNTSGLGSKTQPPMVAIFTHHDPKKADAGKTDVETQSIAYSLDEGATWTKYAGNPVIKNPGVRDFRDPKVFWFAPGNKWVMVVAASDRVRIYDSKNLKSWTEIAQFGVGRGSHESVWECPDLFPLTVGRETKWVLSVSEGNGGPNKGSGTQYFVGDFDGTNFKSEQKDVKWLEYGPDDYAGNTWNNIKNGERLYMGWMTNLMYAGNVPATTWRGEMTFVRQLSLQKIAGNFYVCQNPISGIHKISKRFGRSSDLTSGEGFIMMANNDKHMPLFLQVTQKRKAENFELVFSNRLGDTLKVGLDEKKAEYYIDRGQAGDMSFANGMAPVLRAPKRIKDPASLQIILDRNSIEIFADGGLTVMTALFNPSGAFDKLGFSKAAGSSDAHSTHQTTIQVRLLEGIWKDRKKTIE